MLAYVMPIFFDPADYTNVAPRKGPHWLWFSDYTWRFHKLIIRASGHNKAQEKHKQTCPMYIYASCTFTNHATQTTSALEVWELVVAIAVVCWNIAAQSAGSQPGKYVIGSCRFEENREKGKSWSLSGSWWHTEEKVQGRPEKHILDAYSAKGVAWIKRSARKRKQQPEVLACDIWSDIKVPNKSNYQDVPLTRWILLYWPTPCQDLETEWTAHLSASFGIHFWRVYEVQLAARAMPQTWCAGTCSDTLEAASHWTVHSPH